MSITRPFTAAVILAVFLSTASALVAGPAPVIVAEGDSHSGDYYGAAYVTQLSERTGYPIVNVSVTTQSFAQLSEQAPVQVDPLYDPEATHNILFVWAGVRDWVLGSSPHDIHAMIRDYARARQDAGWEVVVFTLTPSTRQPYFGPDFEADRLALNNMIRHRWRGYADALVDVGAHPVIGDIQTTYDLAYFVDGQHMTPAGHVFVTDLAEAALLDLLNDTPKGKR